MGNDIAHHRNLLRHLLFHHDGNDHYELHNKKEQ